MSTTTFCAGSVDDPAPFGDYELLGLLGSGGMADVYRARRRDAPRQRLAIKCMRPQLAQDSRFLEMFTREGTLAVLLRHPSIVHAYEFGNAAGRPFIAMEYIDGQDLLDVLRMCQIERRHMPVRLAVHIAKAIAEGLHFAHTLTSGDGRELKIVNRDVSPANIRLSYDGAVKLLDFGVARAMLTYTSEAGAVKGKLSYMSPEQIRGLTVDARSDVFSTGIVLHEMLTSSRLFRANDTNELTEMVSKVEVARPSSRNPQVTAPLDEMVLKALRRDRRQRYQTAAALAHDLGRLLCKHPVTRAELGSLLRSLFPRGGGAPGATSPWTRTGTRSTARGGRR